MSKKNQIVPKQTVNVNELRQDVLGFIMNGYYDGHYDCSANAACGYFQRLMAENIAKKYLQDASDEQVIEDQAKIHKYMLALYDNFEENHDEAKKIIDECLDRYVPGLRECRERKILPAGKKPLVLSE